MVGGGLPDRPGIPELPRSRAGSPGRRRHHAHAHHSAEYPGCGGGMPHPTWSPCSGSLAGVLRRSIPFGNERPRLAERRGSPSRPPRVIRRDDRPCPHAGCGCRGLRRYRTPGRPSHTVHGSIPIRTNGVRFGAAQCAPYALGFPWMRPRSRGRAADGHSPGRRHVRPAAVASCAVSTRLPGVSAVPRRAPGFGVSAGAIAPAGPARRERSGKARRVRAGRERPLAAALTARRHGPVRTICGLITRDPRKEGVGRRDSNPRPRDY